MAPAGARAPKMLACIATAVFVVLHTYVCGLWVAESIIDCSCKITGSNHRSTMYGLALPWRVAR